MDYYLFPNFLSSSTEYAKAEAMWRGHWDDLFDGTTKRGEWTTPWLTTTYADGTRFRDGNPIFSAVSTVYRRGIRVIQLQPSAYPRELEFCIDRFDEGGAGELDELVITLSLTRGTLIDALSLMRQWIDEGRIDLVSNVVDSESKP